MTEQEEIQNRHQEIEEFAQRLAEAKKALDLRGWARVNGIDIEQVLEAARRQCSAADFSAASREAEEEAGNLLRDLGQGLRADPLAEPAGAAARRMPRSMV